MWDDHNVNDPLQCVAEDADKDHEFHRNGFLRTGRWRIWWLGSFDCLKIIKCQILFVLIPPPFVPSSDVGMQLCQDVCRFVRPIRWLACWKQLAD